MLRRVVLGLCFMLAIGLVPRHAAAQANWQNSPPALKAELVLLTPLTGGALRHLIFGGINPGSSAQVFAAVNGAPNETNAGKWSFTVANNNRRLWVAFVLPTVLTHQTQTSHTIPISFDFADSGALCEFKGGQCMAFGTFNAADYQHPTGYEHQIVNRPNITAIYVYLGGLVQVPADARAGTYTGTVTLRFAVANN
jgi:hypothetical protein